MARAFVALRGADVSDHDALSAAVRDAEAELEAGLAEQATYSKAQAAHLLDVSTTTLEQWIASGLLPVARVVGYKRDRIPAHPLLALAAQIKQLRRSGRQRGLLVEALRRLEQEDPESYEHLQLLRERASRPFDRSEYVSAKPGPDWAPED